MSGFNFPALIDSYGIDVHALSPIQKIELAEYMMLSSCDNIATELPLTHHINNGLYAREIFLPKGTLLTGKVHNFDHLSTLSKGEVSIMTSEGMTHIKAPFTWHSKAGTKRLIYVHEDTIWTTYHVTDLETVDELENALVHDSDLTWINQLLLSGDNNHDICSSSGGSGYGGGSCGRVGLLSQ